MAEQATVLYNARDLSKPGTDSFRAGIRGAQADLEGLRKQAASLSDTFKTIFVGSLAAGLFKDIIERTIDAERTINQLNSTLNATAHAAGLTTVQVRGLVRELADTTAFDDDGLQKAATALLRFRDIEGPVFEETLRLVPDVATALGVDLVAAAQALGKGLQDPLGQFKLLKNAGVALHDSDESLIKQFLHMGDTASASAVFLDAVRKSMGGAAAGENVGLYGSARATAKAWDDLLKSIGRSKEIQTFVTDALGGLKQVIEDIGDESEEASDRFDGFIEEMARKASEKMPIVIRLFLELGDAIFQAAGRANKDIDKLLDSVAGTGASAQARFVGAGGGRGGTPESVAAFEGGRAADADKVARLARERAIQAARDLKQLVTAQSAAAIVQAQTQAEQLQATLDIAHAAGLVSEHDYYQSVNAIAEDSTKSKIASIRELIVEQQKILKDLDATPDQQGAAKAKLFSLRAEIKDAEDKLSGARVQNNNAEVVSLDKIRDSIELLQAAIDEQEGHLAQAAKTRADIGNRQLRTDITKNFPGDAGKLEKQDQLDRTRLLLQEQDNEAARARQELATDELNIQSKLASGNITELEALRASDQARQNQLSTLRKILAVEEAVENKSPDQIAHVRALKAEIDALAAATDQLGDVFRHTFEDSLTGPLADFITHTKTAKEAFLDFLTNISNALARIAAQNIAESIFGKGGAGAGIPAFFANLFAPTSTSGAATGSSAYAVTNSSAGTLFAGGGVSYMGRAMDLPRFAYGGASGPRQPSIFAEGSVAEAAVPLPDGRNIPVKLQGGGRDGPHYHLNFYGQQSTSSIRTSALQAAVQLNQRLKRAGQQA